MQNKIEDIDGYVVDIACLRKWPADEYAVRARRHSKRCALMGHCVESGFGLIDEAGQIRLLDTVATVKLLDALRAAETDEGIRVRVLRESADGGMETKEVRLL